MSLVCSNCGSADVQEVETLVPSGTRHQIKCVEGHVTHGIPSPAERLASRAVGQADYLRAMKVR